MECGEIQQLQHHMGSTILVWGLWAGNVHSPGQQVTSVARPWPLELLPLVGLGGHASMEWESSHQLPFSFRSSALFYGTAIGKIQMENESWNRTRHLTSCSWLPCCPLGWRVHRWPQVLMTATVAGMVNINRNVASPTKGPVEAGITAIINTTAVMTSGAVIASIKNTSIKNMIFFGMIIIAYIVLDSNY